MKRSIVMLLTLLLNLSASEFNQEDVRELEATLAHNIDAMNKENLDDYMKDIHPLSPAYAGTKVLLKKLFTHYDLKATQMMMKPLMIDEKYFILRGRQKTIDLKGDAPYQDNIAEALHVYKKYKGKWLLWSSMILEILPVK